MPEKTAAVAKATHMYKNYSEAESRICGAKVTGGRPDYLRGEAGESRACLVKM